MVSNLKPAELMNSQAKILVSVLSRVKNLPVDPEVLLHNRYHSLGLNKGVDVNNSGNGQDSGKCNCKKVEQHTSSLRTRFIKKKC